MIIQGRGHVYGGRGQKIARANARLHLSTPLVHVLETPLLGMVGPGFLYYLIASLLYCAQDTCIAMISTERIRSIMRRELTTAFVLCVWLADREGALDLQNYSKQVIIIARTYYAPGWGGVGKLYCRLYVG